MITVLVVGGVAAWAGGPSAASPTVADAPGQGLTGAASLRVDRIRTVGTRVDIEVSVPDTMSGSSLPGTSFGLDADGTPVEFSVGRWADASPQVTLVLQDVSDPSALTALQGAAAEFVGQLPPDSPLDVVVGGATHATGVDRAAALAALREIAPGAGGPARLHAALTGVLRPPGTTTQAADHEAVVVFAQPAAGSRVASGIDAASVDATVSVVQLADATTVDPTLTDLGVATGGDAVEVATAGDLLHGFDLIARELAARYDLELDRPTLPSRVAVTLATPGGTLSAGGQVPVKSSSVTEQGGGQRSVLPAGAARSRAPVAAPPSAGGWPWWAVVLGVAAGAAAGATGWNLLSGRQRPQRDTVVPVPSGASSGASAAAHPQPRRPAVPAVPAGPDAQVLAATGQALDALARQRRAAGAEAVPPGIYVVLEAAASVWIDRPSISQDDAVAAFDPDPSRGDLPIAAEVRRLRAVLGAARTGIDGVPLASVARSLALAEREGPPDRSAGATARRTLSTWASRCGLLPGLPLMISPILTPQDPGFSITDLDLEDHVEALVVAVRESARAMAVAEFELARLRAWYLHQLADDHPDAARLAGLITRWPLVTLDVVGAGLRVDDAGVGALVSGFESRGWLRRFGSTASGMPRWVAHEVIEAVAGPVGAEAGAAFRTVTLPSSPFVSVVAPVPSRRNP